jgi:hypothetical protein
VLSQLHSWNFVTSRTLTWDIFYFMKNKSTLPCIKTSSLKMDNHVYTIQTSKAINFMLSHAGSKLLIVNYFSIKFVSFFVSFTRLVYQKYEFCYGVSGVPGGT